MAMNTMVKVFARSGDLDGLKRFLATSGLPWTDHTYGKILGCMAKAGKPEEIDKVIEELGLNKMDDIRWRQVVDARAQVGDLDGALDAFRNIIDVERKSVGSVLHAYARVGDGQGAADFLHSFADTVGVNVIMMNQVVNAFSKSRQVDEAMEFVDIMMIERDLEPNLVTLTTLLKACVLRHRFGVKRGKGNSTSIRSTQAKSRNVSQLPLFEQCVEIMNRFPMPLDLQAYTMLLGVCREDKENGKQYSIKVFEEMNKQFPDQLDVMAYNALLNCAQEDAAFVVSVLDRMDSQGVPKDGTTMLNCLQQVQESYSGTRYMWERLSNSGAHACERSQALLAHHGIHVEGRDDSKTSRRLRLRNQERQTEKETL